MTRSESELQELLQCAKGGDENALGQLLEYFRPQLREIARERITGKLHVRIDESDMVQQAWLAAFRNFAGFRGKVLSEFVAWLKQIHDRNITDTIRNHAVYQKRSLAREEPSREVVRDATAPVASPSHQAIQKESAARVAAAIRDLPEDQGESVQLRYLEGCSLSEIAQRLNRTEDAVAGLLRRGLAKLRRKLRNESGRGEER